VFQVQLKALMNVLKHKHKQKCFQNKKAWSINTSTSEVLEAQVKALSLYFNQIIIYLANGIILIGKQLNK